ncbi:MAG: hypothetical protein U9R79_20585, partial [Armatimonadota bacterium]|nr:hypothetical protein [Armatimonadota bacterium]
MSGSVAWAGQGQTLPGAPDASLRSAQTPSRVRRITMSLTRINHNISSINAQRNLEINSSRIGRSIERLASGLRINRG